CGAFPKALHQEGRRGPRHELIVPMATSLDPKVDEKLRGIVVKHADLARHLSAPAVVAHLSAFRTLSRQYAQLGPLVDKFQQFRKAADDCRDARELLAA